MQKPRLAHGRLRPSVIWIWFVPSKMMALMWPNRIRATIPTIIPTATAAKTSTTTMKMMWWRTEAIVTWMISLTIKVIVWVIYLGLTVIVANRKVDIVMHICQNHWRPYRRCNECIINSNSTSNSNRWSVRNRRVRCKRSAYEIASSPMI